jgi:hypothetical protein
MSPPDRRHGHNWGYQWANRDAPCLWDSLWLCDPVSLQDGTAPWIAVKFQSAVIGLFRTLFPTGLSVACWPQSRLTHLVYECGLPFPLGKRTSWPRVL